MDTHVVGVILARAGSKGLPKKCILPVAGRPMIAWTIDAALAAETLSAVCLSTDASEAAVIGEELGVAVIPRPVELADDTATVDAAARHAIASYERRAAHVATHVVLLYGNVPVRADGIIDRAVRHLIETGATSVRTLACVDKHHPDWLHRMDGDRMVQYRRNSIYRRQDLEPLYYHDGAVVAVTRAALFAVDPADPHAFFGNDRRGIVQPAEATVDVDALIDLRVAEAILSERGVRQPATRAGRHPVEVRT